MLGYELLRNEGLLVVSPDGPLSSTDFERLEQVVDPYIEQTGQLNGLMIHTGNFPGWSDFAGLLAHISFVRDHHKHIRRVAAVTDPSILATLPTIANLFLQAEVRHFDYNDYDTALAWLKANDINPIQT